MVTGKCQLKRLSKVRSLKLEPTYVATTTEVDTYSINSEQIQGLPSISMGLHNPSLLGLPRLLLVGLLNSSLLVGPPSP
jgi:hypothetical protein